MSPRNRADRTSAPSAGNRTRQSAATRAAERRFVAPVIDDDEWTIGVSDTPPWELEGATERPPALPAEQPAPWEAARSDEAPWERAAEAADDAEEPEPRDQAAPGAAAWDQPTHEPAPWDPQPTTPDEVPWDRPAPFSLDDAADDVDPYDASAPVLGGLADEAQPRVVAALATEVIVEPQPAAPVIELEDVDLDWWSDDEAPLEAAAESPANPDEPEEPAFADAADELAADELTADEPAEDAFAEAVDEPVDAEPAMEAEYETGPDPLEWPPVPTDLELRPKPVEPPPPPNPIEWPPVPTAETFRPPAWQMYANGQGGQSQSASNRGGAWQAEAADEGSAVATAEAPSDEALDAQADDWEDWADPQEHGSEAAPLAAAEEPLAQPSESEFADWAINEQTAFVETDASVGAGDPAESEAAAPAQPAPEARLALDSADDDDAWMLGASQPASATPAAAWRPSDAAPSADADTRGAVFARYAAGTTATASPDTASAEAAEVTGQSQARTADARDDLWFLANEPQSADGGAEASAAEPSSMQTALATVLVAGVVVGLVILFLLLFTSFFG